jgi:CheY-like chemotaxis protein
MLPRPDVILLDFSLPHGDACAIASVLHSAPDLQQIPVIAMLDSNVLPCASTASQLGLADVVTKPLPRNSLGAIILRAVRSRRSHGGKPQTSPLGAG